MRVRLRTWSRTCCSGAATMVLCGQELLQGRAAALDCRLSRQAVRSTRRASTLPERSLATWTRRLVRAASAAEIASRARDEKRLVLALGSSAGWVRPGHLEHGDGALLDRLTHHVHILEMNGDSYRLNQSQKRRKPQKPDNPAHG